MKNIFEKRKRPLPKISLRMQRAGAKFDREQHKWADYLNGKTKHTSPTLIWLGLIIFCVFFGGSCILLCFGGFNINPEKVLIQKITVPGYVITTDSADGFLPLAILSNNQYKNIQRFKRAMDSLQSTVEGKIKYDSICKARPGLMDSVNYTEQMFLQQSNFK